MDVPNVPDTSTKSESPSSCSPPRFLLEAAMEPPGTPAARSKDEGCKKTEKPTEDPVPWRTLSIS